MTISKILRAAERGVPLIGVRTLDQTGFAVTLANALIQGNRVTAPLLIHDPLRGITPGHVPSADVQVNPLFAQAREAEQRIIANLTADVEPSILTEPTMALEALGKLPMGEDDQLFVLWLGASQWIKDPGPALAVVLARDTAAAQGIHHVFVGPTLAPAAELGSDLYLLGETLPDTEERTRLIKQATDKRKLPADVHEQALTYTRGLSRFAASQVCYLALTKEGLDLDVLRGNWREAIDATPGLRVLVDRPAPDAVQGLGALQSHLHALAKGKQRFEAIVFVDEIEKALSGSGGQGAGDTSGSSQAVLGRLLSHLEDTGSEGVILLGPPGTGKTLSAKAAGAILQVPTLELQPGRIKGSLVGQTEEQADRCFSALSSLAGRAYWIVTCNGIASLPPELLRRFTDGVWFCDLPDAKEREAIWGVHLKAFGHAPGARYAFDQEWTGADIRNVCRMAWRLGKTPSEIGAEHVPSTKASAELIQRLRTQAAGRYRSASAPGCYRIPEPETTTTTGRKVSLKGDANAL